MNNKPIVVDDPRFIPVQKNKKKKMSNKLRRQLNANLTDDDFEDMTDENKENA